MTDAQLSRFVIARRRYILSRFQNLNTMQQEAVSTTEGPLLLLAGAGSGKTTVLINRIANLMRFGRGSDSGEVPDTVTEDDLNFLENLQEPLSDSDRLRADFLCALEPVLPWNIIAITFTNKAANELKERLTAMLGPEGQDVWAMTFHSACCRILRHDIERLGFTRSFTIYDTADSERVMKDIIKEMGLDDKIFPAKYVLSVISREKDNMVSAEEMLERVEFTSDIRQIHIAKAYVKYQARLRENNALDFDDIIFHTVQLLQNYEDVRTYYQRKFRYVLVDEYQDTNHMQYLLTSLLAGGYENICVVGDDDQSIYRFRGATIANILDFEKQYLGARVIRLEQNYRSTQAILNAANGVIAHNIGRKGKRLWTANSQGKPIVVYEAADEREEAKYIVNDILKQAGKDRDFSKFAILYRTNAQALVLEQTFAGSGIKCRVFKGMKFYDHAEIKDMLAYLWVVNNRFDDLRLHRIINNPPRGLGAKTIEIADRLAQAEGKGLYAVVSNPYAYGPLEKSAGKLLQFSVLIEELARLLEEGMPLPEFYDELIVRSGYLAMLEAKPTDENRTRIENILELKSDIVAYVNDNDAPTLSGYLEKIALYTELDQPDEGAEKAAVMMTMHSAKGLEFPCVYLVGFEDGLFPGMRAIGEREEMEEERRLCYVAITRAKENLTITYAKQRMLYGRTSASLPSRFLKEIPPDTMVKKGGYKNAPSSSARYAGATAFVPQKPISYQSSYSKSSVGVPLPEWHKGDMVEHTAFGRGMVLSVLKMGGDALMEIAFDQIGTKKLMAKTASAHMKKL